MDIKKTLTSAGIQLGEFAALCGVSRVTMHAWCTGGNMHPLRVPRVEKLLAAVEAATGAGDFPIVRLGTRRGSKAATLSRIKAVVLKHLKGIAKSR